jgi:DNA-directed RNA polymerase subunit alpha
MNIRTLGDLIRHTEQELLSYKNFGETSLQEIKDMLGSKNLRLGMTVEASEERRPLPPAILAPPPRAAGSSARVADLELSARSRKALERIGCATLGDVAALSEEKLLAQKNFGETSLNEIKQVLRRHGMTLTG